MRFVFKRKPIEPPKPTPLDRVRAEIAETIREATDRVDRMLERLQRRSEKDQTS